MSASRETFSTLVIGVGGSGTILASRVIAMAACQAFPFVCQTEARGMSQRGGAVGAQVRFGSRQVAPVFGPGEDLILALDALEGARSLPQLSPRGRLLTHARFQTPAHWGKRETRSAPSEGETTSLKSKVETCLEGCSRTIRLDLSTLAQQADCPKGANAVLLGAASHFLPLPVALLRHALADSLKDRNAESNLRAFQLGHEALSRTEGTSAWTEYSTSTVLP